MPLRFINPNFHVILIHYPLGVFVLGVFLELFSFLWRKSSVRIAARWMIVLGALCTLPAATSGIFALYDVKTNQGIGPRYEMLRWHVIFMGIAAILAVFCAVVGVGASDRWRRKLYLPLLLGVVAAWGLMVVGAWHGGETIYQQGTSVAIITSEDGKPALQELPTPTPHSLKNYDDAVDYYAGGDLQQHLILAGFAFAIALGALGLSMRRMNAGPSLADEETFVRQGAPAAAGGTPRRVTDDISVIRSFNPESTVGADDEARVPSGRFWLLALLAFLVTAGAGYWIMAGQDTFKPAGWDSFRDCVDQFHWPPNRHFAHLILGSALVVLSLLCALLAVAAPKQSILLAFFGMLLVLVIAGQVFMGVLLTFDREGPLTRFKTDEERKAHVHKKHKPATTEPATTDPGEVQAEQGSSGKINPVLEHLLSQATQPTTGPESLPAPATSPSIVVPTPPVVVPTPPPASAPVPPTTVPASVPATAPATAPETPHSPATPADAPPTTSSPDSKPDASKPDAPKPDAPKPEESKPDAK